MKKLLILFFCVYCNVLLAQDLSDFTSDMIDWRKWEKKIPDDQKISIIEKIKSKVLKMFKEYNLDYKQKLDDFHFFDINKNGTSDIVYNGYSFGEGRYLEICLIENDKGKTVLSTGGTLLKIYETNTLLPYSFLVNQFPCCADVVNTVKYFTPNLIDGELKYKNPLLYYFEDQTEFPQGKIEPQNFNIDYKVTLRLFPKEIDKENVIDGHRKGNIIREFHAGAFGTAYHCHINNKREKWCFVAIKITQTEKHFPETCSYYLGWVNASYIEKN